MILYLFGDCFILEIKTGYFTISIQASLRLSCALFDVVQEETTHASQVYDNDIINMLTGRSRNIMNSVCKYKIGHLLNGCPTDLANVTCKLGYHFVTLHRRS